MNYGESFAIAMAAEEPDQGNYLMIGLLIR